MTLIRAGCESGPGGRHSTYSPRVVLKTRGDCSLGWLPAGVRRRAALASFQEIEDQVRGPDGGGDPAEGVQVVSWRVIGGAWWTNFPPGNARSSCYFICRNNLTKRSQPCSRCRWEP